MPLYEVPTIKEYFQDLDEVLSVISDGESIVKLTWIMHNLTVQ